MLSDARVREIKRVKVFRLTRQIEPVSESLLKIGIDGEDVREITDMVNEYVPGNLDHWIDAIFLPRRLTDIPFSVYRFGDGSFPVFYTTKEETTAVEEMRHHSRIQLMSEDGQVREFQMINCFAAGRVMDVSALAEVYPDLVSGDDSGYAFCQAVARDAIGEGFDALYAPSARRAGGVCVPVFRREAVKDASAMYRVKFFIQDGIVSAEKVLASDARPAG